MIKLIIFKELRDIIGSAKFAATFGVCSILIILAFFIGINNYQGALRNYNTSIVSEFSQYENAKDWNDVPKRTVFLPPDLLSSLVTGISNDIGRSGVIYDSAYQSFRDSIYSAQPIFAVFRFLDLEFVFLIILSLFAILFTFDAVNGEKEKGTLRLTFANPVSRAVYITGKLTGLFLAVALPLIVPFLIGMLLIPVMGIFLSDDEWIRLVMLIICGLLYLSVFLSLSVFVSSMTKKSSSSFLFLLIIWVFSVLIIPRASVLLAGNMVEVPSTSITYYQTIQFSSQQLREYMNKMNDVYGRAKELSKSKDIDPEALRQAIQKLFGTLEELRSEQEKALNAYVRRLYEERYNRQNEQEKLALGISRISPSSVFTLAAFELGGTSLELRNNYRDQVTTYSADYSDFIAKKKAGNQEKTKATQAVTLAEIPKFIFQSNELPVILRNVLPDIAILLLFNLVFFSGAFTAFLRYDLR